MQTAAQTELFDQGLVALVVFALQVVQQAAAAVDQLQQATTAVVVLLVGLEVAAEVLDAGGQQSDLDFRGAGVVGAAGVVGNHFLGIDGHGVLSLDA